MPSREEITRHFQAVKAEGLLGNPREDVLWFHTIRPNELHFNTTRAGRKNPVSIKDLTQAELEGRRQIMEMFQWLKTEILGFENSYITRIAAQIGVRESRTIRGAYTLAEEDVISCRKFPDSIGKCSYWVNNAPYDGQEQANYLEAILRSFWDEP